MCVLARMERANNQFLEFLFHSGALGFVKRMERNLVGVETMFFYNNNISRAGRKRRHHILFHFFSCALLLDRCHPQPICRTSGSIAGERSNINFFQRILLILMKLSQAHLVRFSFALFFCFSVRSAQPRHCDLNTERCLFFSLRGAVECVRQSFKLKVKI